MNKSNLLLMSVLALFVAYVSQSCQEVKAEEFVATNSTFVNFQSWTLEDTNMGPSASLGSAHEGNDSTVTREIYFKNGQDPVSGKYPVGTLIAKHSHNPAGTVADFVGMAKRGNGFNASNGDWEWFVLTAAGNIKLDSTGAAMRGANLMGGMCNGCHAGATTDYSFSK